MSFRPWLLWLLPSPLLGGAFFALILGRFPAFATDLMGWGLFMLAAWLTQRGFARSSRPSKRQFSGGWRFSWRNLAGATAAFGTFFVASQGVGYSAPIALAFAGLTLLGYHLAYGLESLRLLPESNGLDRESPVLSRTLAEAEQRLINLEESAGQLGNRELRARLQRIADQGRAMLVQIAERPSELRAARRFLTLSLEGAEQVTQGYLRIHRQGDMATLEEDFRRVLVTIEEQLIERRRRLRDADLLDLDVQIEVLQQQLSAETLPKAPPFQDRPGPMGGSNTD